MLIKAIYIHACIHNFKQLPSIDFQQDYFFDKMIKFDCYSRFPFFCEKKKQNFWTFLYFIIKKWRQKFYKLERNCFFPYDK